MGEREPNFNKPAQPDIVEGVAHDAAILPINPLHHEEVANPSPFTPLVEGGLLGDSPKPGWETSFGAPQPKETQQPGGEG